MGRTSDAAFCASAAISLLSLALAASVDKRFLLLLLGAYLLRPVLCLVGAHGSVVDGRQCDVQFRASHVGFIALVVGNVVVILALMAKDDHAWEMSLAALVVAIVVRSVARLLLERDPAAAGTRILMTTGLVVCLFGLLAHGLSAESLQHILPGVVIGSLGWFGDSHRKLTATLAFLIATLIAVGLASFSLQSPAGANWGTAVAGSLLVAPMVVAGLCLWNAARRPTL